MFRIHEMKGGDFTNYFLCFPTEETANMSKEEKAKVMFQREGILELCHNWGTESDPNFKGYANGNEEPGRGFGHIALSVDNVEEACKRYDSLGVKFKKRPEEGRMRHIPKESREEILNVFALRMQQRINYVILVPEEMRMREQCMCSSSQECLIGVDARRQIVFDNIDVTQPTPLKELTGPTWHSSSTPTHSIRPFNPLEHMSGIAPYHDAVHGDDSAKPPRNCRVRSAAWLIRHQAIAANSDEWSDYMKPFIDKIESHRGVLKNWRDSKSSENPLRFLATWENQIGVDMVSQLTEPGRTDAWKLGQLMRKLYADLMPKQPKPKVDTEIYGQEGDEEDEDASKHPRKDKRRKGKKEKSPFKIFSASSTRDVETSQAFIRGAFPNLEGDGNGDGKKVVLIKVPNDDPRWAESLTPHKICPAFSKERGKPEARIWLETWATPTLARLNKMLPGEFQLSLDNIIAMLMLCGYESVTLPERSSQFCSLDLFTEHDFKAFGSWFDIKYWYQVGYGAEYSPYLGVQWLATATHLLSSIDNPQHDLSTILATVSNSSGKDKLPTPKLPPEEQHAQLLFPFFTHREEPPVVLTALGLWNDTSPPNPFNMDYKRSWVTSHLLPFGGHLALERLECDSKYHKHVKDHDVIRIIVNGAVQKLPHCQDGPGHGCPVKAFGKFIEERVKLYGNLTQGCLEE
ncbi:hypothetical protein OIO90_001713 [Microbotryomycetes sp. JL221]|nr:hypothetical protein OIO90_001713 [Microbotryomycetes sp. JL221]